MTLLVSVDLRVIKFFKIFFVSHRLESHGLVNVTFNFRTDVLT